MEHHIHNTYDKGFEDALTDQALHDKIMASPSIKNKCEEIHAILRSCRLKKSMQSKILQKMIPYIIPQGTKGNIRGNMLNDMVKQRVTTITRNKKKLTAFFEYIPKKLRGIIHERPDWVIEHADGHMVVGYTQIDLWGGGQQINRAAKYILNDALHKQLQKMNVKLICLVTKKPTLSRKKCKTQTVIRKGFKTGRIILPKSLPSVVKDLCTHLTGY